MRRFPALWKTAFAGRQHLGRSRKVGFPVAAAVCAAVCLGAATAAAQEEAETIRVGSKSFTESIILGEIAASLLRESGFEVTHDQALGDASTFQALVRGDIDIYAEYTGTLRQSILADQNLASDDQLPAALRVLGIEMSASIGFENSFALGVTRQLAAELRLANISDLRQHPKLRFGFTESFLNRGDGWPSLRTHYRLPHTNARGMAHDLAYVALAGGDLDVMDLYTTDAEIIAYDLVALADDDQYFSRYEAVYLYRRDFAQRAPRALEALLQLEDAIDSEKMQQMNAAVKVNGRSEQAVAADFLGRTFGYQIEVQQQTLFSKLLFRTREHLTLVGIAMAMGIAVALPLGIAAHRLPVLGKVILASVSVLQTIPSLAFLALMVPLLGIKSPPAIAALFCYSMLPIVRNTHAGLSGISRQILESADALGLPRWYRLWKVELPLATPMVLAGIKTSTVLTIGFATLGAFVGAGGYGEPIMTGIRLQDTGVILQGAIPAALLAVGAEFFFERVDRLLIPRGLRQVEQ